MSCKGKSLFGKLEQALLKQPFCKKLIKLLTTFITGSLHDIFIF